MEEHMAGEVIAATDDSATLWTGSVLEVADLSRGSEQIEAAGQVTTCLEWFVDGLARHLDGRGGEAEG
jgi:hypothetical protein